MPLSNASQGKSMITDFKSKGEMVLSTANTSSSHKSDAENGSIARYGEQKRFRSFLQECLFCLSMAMTQIFADYLISGFAPLVPALHADFARKGRTISPTWPTIIMSMIMAATQLPFARASDKFGGFTVYLSGMVWLSLWSVVAGFAHNEASMSACRAMQGLAVAAFQPASYALVGAMYPPGRARNTVYGICGAVAPLGFYFGIFTSTLVVEYFSWPVYFWVVAVIAFISAVSAVISVPADRINHRNPDLTMDWLGACTITAGLVMIIFALSASSDPAYGWQSPSVLITFGVGIVTLCAAAYIEVKVAKCPLLPVAFFKPKSLIAFVLASLFFYGSLGIWLYYSTFYIQNIKQITNLTFVAWYAPMAVGGIIIALVGSNVMHIVPLYVLFIVSGTAWVLASLLFAIEMPTAPYWAFIFPAMMCTTLGVDLTFLVSNVFLTSSQPKEYQGVAGAVGSILINLGISFALAFADILASSAAHFGQLKKYRSVLWLSTASAAAGLLICLLFVRIPKCTGSLQHDATIASQEVPDGEASLDPQLEVGSAQRQPSRTEEA